jgi:hypothetical protein
MLLSCCFLRLFLARLHGQKADNSGIRAGFDYDKGWQGFECDRLLATAMDSHPLPIQSAIMLVAGLPFL